MAKLNRETKHSVKVGDILQFTHDSYIVTNIIRDERDSNRICFTIRDTKNGRPIYAYPSSKLYGAEIVPFIDEGANI